MFNDVVNDVSYAGLLMRGEILGVERRRFWRDDDKLEIVMSVGVHDHKINRLDDLLPWNWSPVAVAMASQAA